MIEGFLEYLRKRNFNFNRNLVILDIGSRDCMQSIEFNNHFKNSKIYAFECNPNTIPICMNNIKNYTNIKLIDCAVNTYDGSCKFYPINKDKTITTWADGNPGASSLFIANGKYPHETYHQDEITVNCKRIDTILKENNISKVDLIWMDLQGAELLALQSMGKYLNDVEYIHTEVTYQPMYHGQSLFNDIDNILKSNGFIHLNNPNTSGWQEDIVYKNTKF